MWDAGKYLKYSEERGRPFFDLVARVRSERPRFVVDLGCGPGNLTRTLTERWPGARVLGVDNSAEMLEKAGNLAVPGRLEFAQRDISTWSANEPADLIISNAAFQWVGHHEVLIPRLVKMLATGGTLAVQMPVIHDNPAHVAIEKTADDPRWRAELEGIGLAEKSVMPLAWYVERLLDLGMTVDAWQTSYVHILKGPNPVLEWYKGTALRPLLERLASRAKDEFLNELGRRYSAIFPARDGVTLLPFPRLFFVATSPTD
jgi:trans-aconitate 2-methyltransferase